MFLNFRPGITGLAQVSKIDMSTPELLAKTDAEMLQELTISDYFKYLLLTITGKGQGDRIKVVLKITKRYLIKLLVNYLQQCKGL